jgi:hypothetical protein
LALSLVRRRGFWLASSLVAGLALAGAILVGHRGSSSSLPPSVATRIAGPPAVSALEAFARPRRPADALPTSTDAIVGVLEKTFRLEPIRSRLLQTQVASPTAKLYVIPARDGRVCFVLTSGPAGCVASITRRKPNLTVFQPSPRRPSVIFGFVPPDARHVAVVVGARPRSAHLAAGSYWYELPSRQSVPRSVRVSYDDGSSVTTKIVAPPAIDPRKAATTARAAS